MGRNKWTSGGHWDEIIHDGRPTETVSVHVRANSTTKMWLTNNGRWIRNNDGSEGWFEYTNTTRFGITAGITLSKTRFNGLRVTDVRFATIRHDMRSLCLASFHDDGGMEELGLWLAEAGFRDKPLSFFEFDTDGGELHCGVSLSKLLGVATPASMEALGARYRVDKGRIAKLVQGDGPPEDAFAAYVFGAERLGYKGGNDWTLARPYSGEVVIVGLNEVWSTDTSSLAERPEAFVSDVEADDDEGPLDEEMQSFEPDFDVTGSEE